MGWPNQPVLVDGPRREVTGHDGPGPHPNNIDSRRNGSYWNQSVNFYLKVKGLCISGGKEFNQMRLNLKGNSGLVLA